jgi:hypothetical protein
VHGVDEDPVVGGRRLGRAQAPILLGHRHLERYAGDRAADEPGASGRDLVRIEPGSSRERLGREDRGLATRPRAQIEPALACLDRSRAGEREGREL